MNVCFEKVSPSADPPSPKLIRFHQLSTYKNRRLLIVVSVVRELKSVRTLVLAVLLLSAFEYVFNYQGWLDCTKRPYCCESRIKAKKDGLMYVSSSFF